MTDDVAESPARWSRDAAERLLAAADALSRAVSTHAEALAAMGEPDDEVLFGQSGSLLLAALAYAEAQRELTGYDFPFGPLDAFLDDEDEDDEEPELEEGAPISVLQRHDYLVTDVAAVLAAGRAGYLRAWPDDDPAAAEADVTHLGRALYQIAHADGWDSLRRADGLTPVGGVIAVVDQDEQLPSDPDEWSGRLVADDASLIYSQCDVFNTP